MATLGKGGRLLPRLELLFNEGALGGWTDGQLLEWFALRQGEHAELAFTVLLERHGPMVVRVCRGILRNEHDIQDVFQATFLILLRKARSLWVKDSLGPWLHQVAYRTALCARANATRRGRLERRAATPLEAHVFESRDDFEGILQEELARLPEWHRAPIVLCDLEGRTHEQAARHLGLPVGTVKSRISRGKDSLRKQLLKRGYHPDASVIAPASIAPAIPHTLFESTRRLVEQALTSKSIGQGAATTLAQGVYRSMMFMRWSKVATLLFVLGASATGATILANKQVAFTEDKGSSQSGVASKPLAELQSTTIKLGPLKVSAVERGNLEASRSLTVKNPTIASRVVSALPYGKRVTAGQVVLELDPEPYLSRVESLRKPISAAKLAFEEAELQAELAKGEYEKYKNVNLPKAEAKSLNAIKLAESEKEEHEYSLTRIQKIQERVQGLQANNDRAMDVAAINAELDIVDRIQREKLAIKRADLAIAEARLAHQIFLDSEKSSRLKALEMQFQIKQKIEHERVRDYESAQEPLQKLYRGVEACHVKTDIDGILVYDYGFDPDEAMEDGSIISVQPNQPMFRVFNDQEPMRVNATVREAIVDQVAKGQKVLITVDAFPGQRFSGTVAAIAPRPIKDAMNRPPGPIKFYTTMIDLDKVETALRPGMTAGVEIIIKEIDRALAVPVSAVVHLDNKDQIAIRKSGRGFEWREVALGVTNGEVVEVRKGISSGEEVIVTPLELLSEAEREERLGKPRRPARRR